MLIVAIAQRPLLPLHNNVNTYRWRLKGKLQCIWASMFWDQKKLQEGKWNTKQDNKWSLCSSDVRWHVHHFNDPTAILLLDISCSTCVHNKGRWLWFSSLLSFSGVWFLFSTFNATVWVRFCHEVDWINWIAPLTVQWMDSNTATRDVPEMECKWGWSFSGNNMLQNCDLHSTGHQSRLGLDTANVQESHLRGAASTIPQFQKAVFRQHISKYPLRGTHPGRRGWRRGWSGASGSQDDNTGILASFTKGLEFQIKRILRNGRCFVVEKPTPPPAIGINPFAPRLHLQPGSAIYETLASTPFGQTAIPVKRMSVERPHTCVNFCCFDFPDCDWELCPAPWPIASLAFGPFEILIVAVASAFLGCVAHQPTQKRQVRIAKELKVFPRRRVNGIGT